MKHSLAFKKVTSISAFELLDEFVIEAAGQIAPFIQLCDLEGYMHFLDTMYHYTLTSEAQLKTAAQRSPSEELQQYFVQQAKEERGHYLLAQRDLEGFGRSVSLETPTTIIEYRHFWNDISHDDALKYLGAVYVFENISKYLAADCIALMKRLSLKKTQSRWLRVHLEADVHHGAEAEKICNAYLKSHAQEIISGAKDFGILWSAIFRDAFKKRT